MADKAGAGVELHSHMSRDDASAPGGEPLLDAGAGGEAGQLHVQKMWERPHIPSLSNAVEWPWQTTCPGGAEAAGPAGAAAPAARKRRGRAGAAALDIRAGHVGSIRCGVATASGAVAEVDGASVGSTP